MFAKAQGKPAWTRTLAVVSAAVQSATRHRPPAAALQDSSRLSRAAGWAHSIAWASGQANSWAAALASAMAYG